MKQLLLGLTVLTAVAVAGLNRSPACPPVAGGVGVCINGDPVAWPAGGPTPHMHEKAGYYAPVADLARALGVKAEVAADQKSVRVGGREVVARAEGAKGLHHHQDRVFAPIREFAEAAGFRVEVDPEKHTINIQK